MGVCDKWMDDEYSVEWALSLSIAGDLAPAPVPAPTPAAAPKPQAARHIQARKRRPEPGDDYWARRAREECARLRTLFDRTEYRRELAQIMADAKRRNEEYLRAA